MTNPVIGYLKLRLQIYQHQTKQLWQSITQVLGFLMLALYLALPIFVLTGFMLLGWIAEPSTTDNARIGYQWLYFLMLFVVVKIQSNAITASCYQPFLTQYPIARYWQKFADAINLVLAANVLLLAPLYLLLFWLASADILTNGYYLWFCLAAIMVSYLAMTMRFWPVFSLVVTPLVLMQWPITSNYANMIWLAALFVDNRVFNKIKIPSFHTIHIRFYWQLKWFYLREKFSHWQLRSFCILSIIVVYRYFQHFLPQLSSINWYCVLIYLLALVVGTSQFDRLAFQQDYRYFINQLPKPARYYFWQEQSIQLLLLLPLALLLQWAIAMPLFIALLLLPYALLVNLCVQQWQRNFFIVPSIVLGVLEYYCG